MISPRSPKTIIKEFIMPTKEDSKASERYPPVTAPRESAPVVPVKSRAEPVRALSYQVGVASGSVDVTGVVPKDVYVDPEIMEGRPGYEESGSSELAC
jgi:hypothetical protein